MEGVGRERERQSLGTMASIISQVHEAIFNPEM